MEDKFSDQKNIMESKPPDSPSNLNISKILSNKYPYLTAFVGFITLCIFSVIIAELVVPIPLLIYSEIIHKTMHSPAEPLYKFILEVFLAFHAFRYVINKHVLPNIDKLTH